MLGAEMMMKNMLKAAGIDPQVVIEQVTTFGKEFVAFVQRTDARSEELLARMTALENEVRATREQVGAIPLAAITHEGNDAHG